MRILTKRRVAVTAVAAGALGVSIAGSAFADYAPSNSDVVGVGSDTLQYMLNFGADGHPALGPCTQGSTGCHNGYLYPAATGYNAIGNAYKLVSIDATADSNARAAYANGSSTPLSVSITIASGSNSATVNTTPFPAVYVGEPVTGATCTDTGSDTNNATIPAGTTVSGVDSATKTITFNNTVTTTTSPGSSSCTFNDTFGSGLKLLNPSVVLRAGMLPIYRPNGSGDGQSALTNSSNLSNGTLNSNSTSTIINFARSSSSVSSAASYAGELYLVRLGKEDLTMVAATSTNAIPLTETQLANIYQCKTGYRTWTDVGGTSSDQIIPEIPQSGSGTRNTFLDNIGSVIGDDHTNFPLGSCVVTTEENDPTAVAAPSGGTNNQYGNSMDEISPFSGARLALYNEGYFYNPGVKFGGPQTVQSPGIKQLLSSTASNNGNSANLIYDNHRSLYVMLLPGDVNKTAGWQPGDANDGSANWAQDLFVGSYSYFGSAVGQSLIAAAGASVASGDGYSNCGVVNSC
jgi:hypothetical protein